MRRKSPAVNFTLKSIDVVKEDEPLVKTASAQLDEAIEKIREIAAGLMPSSLEHKGLKVALEDFIGLLIAPLTIHLHYLVTTTIPEEKSTHIYRLLTEIMQNALKHSEATELFLQLKSDDNKIYIVCEDNGKGFDYTKAMQSGKGIGLRNLKSRTELMDGKFALYSVAGKGTQYRITIPLKENKSHD